MNSKLRSLLATIAVTGEAPRDLGETLSLTEIVLALALVAWLSKLARRSLLHLMCRLQAN